MGGHLENLSVGVRSQRYLYQDLDTSYSESLLAPWLSFVSLVILIIPSISGPDRHCVLLHLRID